MMPGCDGNGVSMSSSSAARKNTYLGKGSRVSTQIWKFILVKKDSPSLMIVPVVRYLQASIGLT